MNNRTEKFKKKLIPAAFFILIMAGACHNNSGIEKGNLIPEKALISILTDVYLADGLLSLNQINDMFTSRDSVTNYIEIIESYGYTKRSMDNTIKYYIISKPKRLIRIYDQALSRLSKMESLLRDDPELTTGSVQAPVVVNSSHILPDPEGKEKPGFDFVLTPPGYFSLKFTVTVYPDDKSVNPCFTAVLSSADTTMVQTLKYLPIINYHKNGLPYTHTVSGKIEGNETLVLKGWFYDYENKPDIQGQHAIIENISFSVTGNE